MIRLYCATDGDNWATNTNWLSPNHLLSEWHGISVSQVQQDLVIRIDLPENQLRGKIPAELSNLTSLTHLNLSRNQLSGAIPAELGNMTEYLQYLYLDRNQLSGTIPTELGNLNALTEVYLWGNRLSGTIPTELGNLLSLTGLSFSRNQLSGTIPTELGNLNNLIYLYLNSNQLSGTIPTELGSLSSSLVHLYLWGNKLSGEIPTELGSLTRLTHLSLSRNELSGTIPAGLSSLAQLQELYLNNNQLSGTIPTELGSLTNLTKLYLNNNELSGAIPTGLVDSGDLRSLQILDLSNNQLSGEITGQIGNLTALKELYLSNNKFSGWIPPELNALTDLTDLYLNNNQFDTISSPAFIDNQPFLKRLYLNDNQLSGEILYSFLIAAAEGELQELGFWGNPDLTWNTLIDYAELVPAGQKVDRAALRSLYENNNGANWRNKDNWLDAENLGDWHGVTTNDDGRVSELNLANNGLTGEITNALEVMGGLENLNLSRNRSLRGTLPVRLRHIGPLASLDTRCTGVSVPADTDFREWLGGISFRGTCPPPPPPPAVIDDDAQGVRHSEETESGFPLTLEKEGYFVYRRRRINLSVTRNEGVSSDYNPAIIVPRAVLDRVLGRGKEITLELSGDSSQVPPSGFRLAGFAAEIDLGVELAEGETVTVCLPPAEVQGESYIHHYDETEEAWKSLESRLQNVNGDDMVCAETGAFSLFGVFLPVIKSAEGVRYSGNTREGFSLTPLGEGGSVVYGQKTIDLSVTRDECPSPGNPAVTVSRSILDRVEEITLELSGASPEDPPPGFRLEGCAAEIDLGVTLGEGETVAVCLPSAGGDIYRYSEESGEWEVLPSRPETVVNSEEVVCGDVGGFSLTGVFVEEPGGCVIASAGGKETSSVFNLLLTTVSVLLVTAGKSRLRL